MFAPSIDIHDVNGYHWVNLWSEVVGLQQRRGKEQRPLMLVIHEDGVVIKALVGGVPIPAGFPYPTIDGLRALARSHNAGFAIGLEVEALAKLFAAFERPMVHGDDFLTLVAHVVQALSRMSDVGMDVTWSRGLKALPPRLFMDQLFNLAFPDGNTLALYVMDQGKVFASLILSKQDGLISRISTDDSLGAEGLQAARWPEDLPRLNQEFERRFGKMLAGIFIERSAIQPLLLGELPLKEALDKKLLIREPWPLRYKMAEWVWQLGWGRSGNKAS